MRKMQPCFLDTRFYTWTYRWILPEPLEINAACVFSFSFIYRVRSISVGYNSAPLKLMAITKILVWFLWTFMFLLETGANTGS